jgi:outer membrane protein assembly factor BamB
MTLAVSIVLGLFSDMAQAQSVLQYHDSAARSGNYVIPGLTPDHARSMHLDPAFDGRVDGHLYAQPLLLRAAGHELLLVATEDDVIEALDAGTGKSVWRKSLGHPVPSSMLPCGNINPLGVTGTPVIDQGRHAIYLDAMVTTDDGPQHLVFGLSVDNGTVLPGFPVNVAQALAARATTFTAADQNQRGALLVFQSTLFIPYGGHFGDCGRYHGWVVGLGLDEPHPVNAWSTRATGGGIWAPGGIASDGHSLFVTTGNTFEMGQWGDGEAVLRLSPNLKPTANASDYFAPANWRLLDRRDADLGGTSPLPIDVRDSAGTVHLMLALGKDGKAYLLNRDNLGGIGGALAAVQVASEEIITAPATYPAPDGGAFVVFHSKGINCPAAVSNPSLGALKIQAHPSPAILTAWCSGLDGAGEPIVTTTDGSANPIVWIVGAEGDNRLHAFDGENGKSLLTGPQPAMQGLRHFATIVATQDHLYVPADGRVYAFTP